MCQINERHTAQHEHQQEVGEHLLLTQCQHTKVRIPELLHLLCRQRPLGTRLHFRINILEQHRIVPLYTRWHPAIVYRLQCTHISGDRVRTGLLSSQPVLILFQPLRGENLLHGQGSSGVFRMPFLCTKLLIGTQRASINMHCRELSFPLQHPDNFRYVEP